MAETQVADELKRLEVHKANYDQAVANRTAFEREHKVSGEMQVACELVADLTKEVATQIQRMAFDKIEGLVTRCLDLVLGPIYEFKLNCEIKSGRTQVSFAFLKDGNPIDPMEGTSGGAKDVASFALRLVALVMSNPRTRLLMVLDEPFKWVSKDHRANVSTMMEELAEEFDAQFIIVTHIDELKIGTIHHVSR